MNEIGMCLRLLCACKNIQCLSMRIVVDFTNSFVYLYHSLFVVDNKNDFTLFFVVVVVVLSIDYMEHN